MALSGSTDDEKIKELIAKSHKDQAIWFLNAFWKSTGEKEAERIWKFVLKFNELDLQKGKEGNALDELNAHKFLESFKETMTVVDLRNKLRESGAIPAGAKPKEFPISHFLIARFGVNWHTLVNATQGDNAEEISKAQKLLTEAQAAIPEAQKRESESKAAALEVQNQQRMYDAKTEELTKKTQEGNVVQQNKAKAELAAHLSQDPLPLSRAKITAEAAAKKAEKALATAQARVDELEKYLKELQMRSGSAQGALWWIDRELHEAKAYLPEKKGGYKKQA
jgi:flagellar biosynthesis GTPase FlhF